MKKKNPIAISLAALLACATVPAAALTARTVMELSAKNEGVQTERAVKSISLTFPVNGQSTSILKPNVVKYIEAMHEHAKTLENDYVLHNSYITGEDGNVVKEYETEFDQLRVNDFRTTSNNEEKSKLVALVFDASGFANNQVYKVTYGLKQDLSDGIVIETTDTFVTVSNLFANKTYYWKVSTDDVSSEVQTFNTFDGFRMITANGITNVRDMGGRPVKGGKHIKQGLIFRGGELVSEDYTVDGSTHHKNLTDENVAVMRDELGITYEIDLRGDAESNNITESPLKDVNHNVDYLRIPNMPAYEWFYKKIVLTDFEHREGIKQMMLAFKNANNKHVYFHCRGGADRTGTVGFLLGGLLGMSYTDLIIDYELTTFSGNYRPHNINDNGRYFTFPAMIYAIKNIKKPNSDETYWTETKEISVLIEEILIDYLGLTKQDINDIKANLIED